MKEEKKFNTPYEQFLDWSAEEQCSLCRFNNKKKIWYCDIETIWKGDNPCAKSQEYLCPIARNKDDIDI